MNSGSQHTVLTLVVILIIAIIIGAAYYVVSSKRNVDETHLEESGLASTEEPLTSEEIRSVLPRLSAPTSAPNGERQKELESLRAPSGSQSSIKESDLEKLKAN